MPVLGGNAINHNAAYKGMPSGLQLRNIISKLNTGAVGIQYGEGVITDGDEGAIIPSASFTANEFIGVSYRELNRVSEITPSVDDHVAPPKFNFSVMTRGEIWVYAVTAVAKDDPAFLIFSGAEAGNFQNVEGTTVIATAIPGAKFTSTATAGTLVKLSLNIGG